MIEANATISLDTLQVPAEIAKATSVLWRNALKVAPKIAAVSKELLELKAGTGEGFRILGVQILEHCKGDHAEALILFQGATKQQETRAVQEAKKGKSEEEQKGISVRTLIPSWATTKATVVAAYKSKLSLSAKVPGEDRLVYPNMTEIRKAIGQQRGTGGSQNQTQTRQTVQAFERGTAPLNAVMKSLANELSRCTEEQQDQAANWLADVVGKVQKLRGGSVEASEGGVLADDKENRRQTAMRGGRAAA